MPRRIVIPMAKAPMPQDSGNHQDSGDQTDGDQTGHQNGHDKSGHEQFDAQDAESFHRLAGLLAEVSSELDQLCTHLHEEAPEGEGPTPEARTPDPPPGREKASNGRMTGGEPVDTSFAAPRTPVAQAAGVSRFGDAARWPGRFAVVAALCGSALLVITAATDPELLSPTQIVGGFAFGAGLFGLWNGR